MKKNYFHCFLKMTSHSSINLSILRQRSSSSNNASNNGDGETEKTELPKNVKIAREELASKFAEKEHLPSHQVVHQEQMRTSSRVPPNASSTASGDACISSIKSLKDDFYDVPCEQLARSLLGKILVRRLDDGQVLKGRVVETECYLGGEDQASHSFRGKMTERNAPMFMKPGTSYVYFTYGMYHCFNISSQGAGAAVLIRALEPVQGMDVMARLRARGPKTKKTGAAEEQGERKSKKPPLRPHELCNGPSKLCMALDIDRDECNKRDLASWPGLCFHDPEEEDAAVPVVVATKRVGIESAGREWADKPLRFYLLGNASVSKRDRAKEKALSQ